MAVPKEDIQLFPALILKLWEQGKVLLAGLHQPAPPALHQAPECVLREHGLHQWCGNNKLGTTFYALAELRKGGQDLCHCPAEGTKQLPADNSGFYGSTLQVRR